MFYLPFEVGSFSSKSIYVGIKYNYLLISSAWRSTSLALSPESQNPSLGGGPGAGEAVARTPHGTDPDVPGTDFTTGASLQVRKAFVGLRGFKIALGPLNDAYEFVATT